MQPPHPALPLALMNEDCLFLNVWAPGDSGTALPVIA